LHASRNTLCGAEKTFRFRSFSSNPNSEERLGRVGKFHSADFAGLFPPVGVASRVDIAENIATRRALTDGKITRNLDESDFTNTP